MKMTFEEYDTLMAKYEKMSEHVCWPSPEQVENFKSDPDKWLLFCVFLYETNPSPSTDEEKASRKAMMHFIHSELELVDEEEMDRAEKDTDVSIK